MVNMELQEISQPDPILPDTAEHLEEQRIAANLKLGPKAETDSDRVIQEMRESMRRIMPGAYHALTSSSSAILPIMLARHRVRKHLALNLSEDEYKALGSPPLLAKICFRLSVAKE